MLERYYYRLYSRWRESKASTLDLMWPPVGCKHGQAFLGLLDGFLQGVEDPIREKVPAKDIPEWLGPSMLEPVRFLPRKVCRSRHGSPPWH